MLFFFIRLPQTTWSYVPSIKICFNFTSDHCSRWLHFFNTYNQIQMHLVRSTCSTFQCSSHGISTCNYNKFLHIWKNWYKVEWLNFELWTSKTFNDNKKKSTSFTHFFLHAKLNLKKIQTQFSIDFLKIWKIL